MRLYLIRHCESENNALWARTGSGDGRSEDPLLTPTGIAQADILAAYLANNNEPSPEPHEGGPMRGGLAATHLYTSLMQRAIQTASPISRALQLPLVAWIDLHERGGIYMKNQETGENEGLPGPNRSYFEVNYPYLQLPESFGEEGWWGRPYEEREAAAVRARGVLDMLLDRHGDTNDHVLFVTHGGFSQSILQVLFDLPIGHSTFAGERFVWFKSNNGSITRLDITDNLLRLAYLNYIDYMPGELLT